MTTILELFGVEENVSTPPLPEDSRERFAELLRRRELIELPSSLQAQEQLEDELLEMYKQRVRRKPKLPKGHEGARHPKLWEKIRAACEPFATERDEIIARHQAQHEEKCQKCVEQREEIDGQLSQLALVINVQPGLTWTQMFTVSNNEYRSQTQANWYAHGDAELQALAYVQGGFETEIREVTTHWDRPDGQRMSWKTYEVWVRIDDLDAKVLEIRGEDELDEKSWLQACHDRALNPRVYRPFLDWGTEDRLGVQRDGHVVLGEKVPLIHTDAAFSG